MSTNPDTKTVRKRLGNTIREYRCERNISQEKLAELAGVHRNYIGKIERGEQNITINKLVYLAGVFNRTLSEILTDAGI